MMKHMCLVVVAGCLCHAVASRLHTYLSLTKSLHMVPKLTAVICPVGLIFPSFIQVWFMPSLYFKEIFIIYQLK